MEVYTYSEKNGCEIAGNFSGTSLCLGYFDGVHLAHRKLFEVAGTYGKWGVLLFDRNVKNMPLLTTMHEKIELIREFGADYVIVVEFSEEFMNKTPEEFTNFLANTLMISRVVAGYDYRFGKNASGNAEALVRLSKVLGISAEIVDAMCEMGEPIKSTKIRRYIEKGDILAANRLLGYPYLVSGKVEKGLGNGHKLGFPTANIAYEDEKLLPADGVYYGRVFGKNAVVNIGKNPTFDAKRRTIEAHIIGFDGDLYGKMAEVSFLEKIREDFRFETKEELMRQIEKDIEFVKGR